MTIKNNDISASLQQQVKSAIETKTPLRICAGNSKDFYGNTRRSAEANIIDISQHTGVVSYEPTELYITVRAGTKLKDIEALLHAQQQILPFEPPLYNDNATIGGAIAAGIAGPRRAYTGSIRDSVLGVQMINGEGEIVNFGGQVVKNVAGYDLSRLMTRSLGTLGVLLNVSIRLLPKPSHDLTLVFEASQKKALSFFQGLCVQQLPITATLWHKEKVYIRVSASKKITALTQEKLSARQAMENLDDGANFWKGIRDHKHDYFSQNSKPLWRLAVAPATGAISHLDDEQLIEWEGAQRWIKTNAPENIIRSIAKKHGAILTSFKDGPAGFDSFPALEPALFQLHKQLKKQMDPHHIFNPDRMYEGL